MGQVILRQRKGTSSMICTPMKHRKGAARLCTMDFPKLHSYIKGIMKDIIHDPGCGTPLIKVVFWDPYRFKKRMELIIAVKDIHTEQFMYCVKKAQQNIGNVLPVGTIPEGTIMWRQSLATRKSWPEPLGTRPPSSPTTPRQKGL